MGNALHHRHNVASSRARLIERLTFPLEQLARRRRRPGGPHELGGVPRRADHYAPLLGDHVEVARPVRRSLLQHVREASQIDFCGERAQKESVIPADRDHDDERRLAERCVPEGITDERVSRAQVVELVLRKPESGAASAARQHLTVAAADGEAIVRRKVLTDRGEIIA